MKTFRLLSTKSGYTGQEIQNEFIPFCFIFLLTLNCLQTSTLSVKILINGL
jgi:hypothetical protein